GKNVEIRGSTRNVDVRGEARGFAGIADFGCKKLVEAAHDAVSHLTQQGRTLLLAHLAPRPLESAPRRFHRLIDSGCIRLANQIDQFAVNRVAVLESQSGVDEAP